MNNFGYTIKTIKKREKNQLHLKSHDYYRDYSIDGKLITVIDHKNCSQQNVSYETHISFNIDIVIIDTHGKLSYFNYLRIYFEWEI